jgi:hypothetical protein
MAGRPDPARARRTGPREPTLTGRIRQLAERYATPLPQLAQEVDACNPRLMNEHLKKMGFAIGHMSGEQIKPGYKRTDVISKASCYL